MSREQAMDKPMKVLQVGPDAVGASALRALIARSDMPYELEAVATTDPDLRGSKLVDTPFKGPPELDDVPCIGMVDAIENTDAEVVFSNLAPKLVSRYEPRLAPGRLVVTNESASRERPGIPVVSAFVNPGHMDEIYRPYMKDSEGRMIDTGSSLAAIMSVPLAPLHRKLGIRSMAVSSLQGWSDAGMSRVPQLAVETQGNGDTRAIEGDDKKSALRSDIARLLGVSMGYHSGMDISSVQLHHGQWVRGHYARMDLDLARETSKDEVEELWRDFKVPAGLDDARSQIRSITKAFHGKRWPGRYHSSLVKLEHELLSADTDPPVLHGLQPMRVQARVVASDPESPTQLAIEVAGDNIVQGLAGGALLDVIYARTQGYL